MGPRFDGTPSGYAVGWVGCPQGATLGFGMQPHRGKNAGCDAVVSGLRCLTSDHVRGAEKGAGRHSARTANAASWRLAGVSFHEREKLEMKLPKLVFR